MTQAPSPEELKAINKVLANRQGALVQVFGNDYAHNLQTPVVFLDEETLESPPSIRFYKKDFAYLSKQLYLEYQYRSWISFNQDVLARYNEVITKKLANINILMDNTITRLEKLLSQNNVSLESTLYPNPVTLTVPVIATHARSYFLLLVALDRVNLLAGTANLLGVIDSTQRAQAEYICKKAVRAFRSIMQTEVIKIYREAQRVIQEQRTGGKVNEGMSAIVEQQGKEIAAFTATANDGSDADASLDLGGMDPAKLIDDAAAASVATNKGKAKAKAPVPAPAAAEAATPAA
jgi:hypothetical protein